MVTRFSFPLQHPLPELGHNWQGELARRDWDTYSVGVRVKDPLKKEWTAKIIRERVANHPMFNGKKTAFEFPDVEIVFDEVEKQIHLQLLPIIITGKYTKLTRTIAQTRHYCFECKGVGRKHGAICSVCKGEKVLTKESVQELIAPFFQNAFTCGEVLFHGAGREDVDVRMLGSGRPFALTLENPAKRRVDMRVLESEINVALKDKVQLSNLQIGLPNDVAYTTQKYHTKRYRALVESSEKINMDMLQSFLNQKMDVLQTTPLRVEKRRAMKERPHWITLEKVTQIDESHIEIELHASAGCYIKEFISGDQGRSLPSLSEWLKTPCVCKELDVLEIVETDFGVRFE
ncbi:MAG: tRNA pseudouridine(54/55) synthase Pus10 [archaeon]